MNPMNTFIKDGKSITYKVYYEKQYGLQIKDNKQPLLLSIKKEKNSDQKIIEREIYLIPELVKVTGMTDNERKNFKVM